MFRRITSIVLAISVLLLSVIFLPGMQALALTATLRPPTFTPTRTPTTSCTVPTYYVTVTPSASNVNVGDQMVVTVRSNVGIASYSLNVIDNATGTTQSPTDPIFTPAPPASQIPPGGVYTVQWTLTAVRAGSVTFRGSAYGEVQFCSGGNIGWTYGGAAGQSGPVTVSTPPTPTVTLTPPAGSLPDLKVLSITEYGYTLPTATLNAQGCRPGSYPSLGLRVTIQNAGTADAGAFILDLNGVRPTVNGLAAGQTLAVDFQVGLTRSRIATVDATGLVAESDETNNTYSLILSAATSTRTGTPRPTFCISRTPTATPTITATPTATTQTRTPTITPTTPVGTCSPVSATIAAPFTYDGGGSFCWQTSNLGSYINSWNLANLTINGVNVTNTYLSSGSYPAKINGFWYVRYTASYPWSHFEAK